MDSSQFQNLSQLWFRLQKNKEIHATTVHNRIPKENLSKEDLGKPHISEQITKVGYYEVSDSLSLEEIKVLEELINLGYLEKRAEKMYKVDFSYTAHPYLPHIGIEGHLGLQLNSTHHFDYSYFDSKQFENFVATAKSLNEHTRLGLHKHVKFDYNLEFNYETDVYEMKDKYFDAILVGSFVNNSVSIFLSQPFVQRRFSSKKEKSMKNWNKIREIPLDDFLTGPSKIDPLIDQLAWKKELVGYLMYEDQAYEILVEPQTSEEEKNQGLLSAPDFFDTDEFSAESMRSRLFEEVVANFIREKGYAAKTRVKYFGKEIDVFSENITEKSKDLIICECKMRMDDSPITLDEVELFNEKKDLVAKHEVCDKCEFWLVSNTEQLMDGVKNYADEHDIKIQTAKLPKNWKARSDWTINNLVLI